MDKLKARHYEDLFNKLLERGNTLHEANKKRIRVGLIFLGVFTVAMLVIRLITESDRATFLMIWVIGMFAISIYLLGIEYIDSEIEKTLIDVTENENVFDTLLPDSEQVRERVQTRVRDRHNTIHSGLSEKIIRAYDENQAEEREDEE